jgi:hypothetical protein
MCTQSTYKTSVPNLLLPYPSFVQIDAKRGDHYKPTYSRTYQALAECRHFGDILPS